MDGGLDRLLKKYYLAFQTMTNDPFAESKLFYSKYYKDL